MVIVDDHEIVVQGIKAMLARYSGRVRIVGDARDADAAVRLVAGLNPDIVLCDVRMRETSGLDLCRRQNPSRGAWPGLRRPDARTARTHASTSSFRGQRTAHSGG